MIGNILINALYKFYLIVFNYSQHFCLLANWEIKQLFHGCFGTVKTFSCPLVLGTIN